MEWLVAAYATTYCAYNYKIYYKMQIFCKI